jgi:HD-GYP domain-containing protein (c-di-GMP phosphodiesterase class II)
MKEVLLSSLEAGITTSQEYFTREGAVLIPSGTLLSQEYLEKMKARGIEAVYSKEIQIPKLMEDIEEICKTARLPELAGIKRGKEGLIQLIKGNKGADLDALIKDGKNPDKPTGPMLKDSACQVKNGERSAQYKESIKDMYQRAFFRIRTILDSLAEGELVSAEAVRSISCQFVNVFLTDRDILLNISGTKPSEGDYVYHHSLNVCILSICIAASFGYNEHQIIEIGMGALLHDAGMLLVPKDVRFKNEQLDEDDWSELKKHPVLGLYLIDKIKGLPESVPIIVYQSHERDNGKGYPRMRSSKMIHNYARIVSIADVYEALTSPRVYHDANIPYKAMETIVKLTRQGIISGEYAKAFLECMSLFPVGSVVELSNKCIGKVVRANPASFSKPVVSVITDSTGQILPENRICFEDLSKNTNLQIVRAYPAPVLNADMMLGF